MHHAAQYDGRAHALDVDEHVGAAVLDRLEAADRPAELHPVLRVLDRHLEHARRRRRASRPHAKVAPRSSERVDAPRRHRAGTRRRAVEARASRARGCRSIAGSRGGRPIASRSTANSAGPSASTRDHDREVGRRRVRHRIGPAGERPVAVGLGATASGRRSTRRTRSLALEQPPPRGRAAGDAALEREHRRQRTAPARRGGRSPRAAPRARPRRARGRRRPRPARRRASPARPSPTQSAASNPAPVLGRRAHRAPRAAAQAVEQLAGAVAQRELVVGEVEVHRRRSLASGPHADHVTPRRHGYAPDDVDRSQRDDPRPQGARAVSEPPASSALRRQGDRAPRRARHRERARRRHLEAARRRPGSSPSTTAT